MITNYAKGFTNFVDNEQVIDKDKKGPEIVRYNELLYTSNGTMREEAKFQTRMVRLQNLMKDINPTYPTDYELGMGEEMYVEYTLKALIQLAQD